MSYLSKSQQALWRRRLQGAYEKPTYAEVQAALQRIRQELRLLNAPTVASLKTTNCLESMLSKVTRRTGKVCRWRNSDQEQRWTASVLLDIGLRLPRIMGYCHLPLLRAAVQRGIRCRENPFQDQVA